LGEQEEEISLKAVSQYAVLGSCPEG